MNGHLKRFERAVAAPREPMSVFISRSAARGVPIDIAQRAWDKMLLGEIWKNDEYQVVIDRDGAHGFGDLVQCWHLSIKRLDQKPIHDWRDLQAIKSMLVGPEFEAIELYPAESRVMDAANQYHLWVFAGARGEPEMIPVGVTSEREVTGPVEARVFGAKQRPLGKMSSTG